MRSFVVVSPLIRPCVSLFGIMSSARVIWIQINHAQWGCFGIIIVYAPNIESKRAKLWRDLFLILDNCKPWLLTHEVNMIENTSDHMGNTSPRQFYILGII